MGRRGRVDADGPLVGARRRRARPVARPFRIRHFGTLRPTEGPPSAVFDADGCGTPRDTPRMPITGGSFGFGRCRTELKSWRLRRIRCNLACQYDPEVHDDAGDTVERGWGWVGGVEWMPTDPWLDGGPSVGRGLPKCRIRKGRATARERRRRAPTKGPSASTRPRRHIPALARPCRRRRRALPDRTDRPGYT